MLQQLAVEKSQYILGQEQKRISHLMYVHMYLYMYASMHASKWNWQKDTHQCFIWGPWLNCHHSSPLQRPGGSGTSVCVGVRCLCLDALHFNFGRSQSPCTLIGYQLAGYMWLVCCLSATQCYKNPSSLKPQNDPSLVWYYLQLGCFQVCPLCWGQWPFLRWSCWSFNGNICCCILSVSHGDPEDPSQWWWLQ